MVSQSLAAPSSREPRRIGPGRDCSRRQDDPPQGIAQPNATSWGVPGRSWGARNHPAPDTVPCIHSYLAFWGMLTILPNGMSRPDIVRN